MPKQPVASCHDMIVRMEPSAAPARQQEFAAQPLPRNWKVLSARFFNRDASIVARELLGKLLVRRYTAPRRATKAHQYCAVANPKATNHGTALCHIGQYGVGDPKCELLIGRVVEAEAYLGQIDPAAHAFNGKTPRNAVLFGPPGIAYVYFIYGNHYCLNVSCMPEGHAGCVLFRALEPVAGLATMAKLRGLDLCGLDQAPPAGNALPRSISSGPGRLTQAMAITRQAHNGMALTSASSELFLTDDGWRPERTAATARINVTKAADRLLRYVIAGNPFVSAKRIG
jgi:DNA-3-methyladenine glycosylase